MCKLSPILKKNKKRDGILRCKLAYIMKIQTVCSWYEIDIGGTGK